MKIIVCGLKIAGKGHIQLMLDNIEERQQDAWSMIAGFDMVNEEDYNAPIDEFLEQILTTKQKMGDNFQVILHAGESNSRDNKELYDAILLGSKRIGHGFAIAKHPKLIELVKEKNICLECCPVSNLVLGYTRDLRCHPARGLIA
jgi:adenosine deaminase CECR1